MAGIGSLVLVLALAGCTAKPAPVTVMGPLVDTPPPHHAILPRHPPAKPDDAQRDVEDRFDTIQQQLNILKKRLTPPAADPP